jgi:hypothetical protein
MDFPSAISVNTWDLTGGQSGSFWLLKMTGIMKSIWKITGVKVKYCSLMRPL